MRIVETPVVNPDLTSHRYRQDQFLIWVAENKALGVARLWAKILSPKASYFWYKDRNVYQNIFKKLYLEYCEDKGIDTSDIIYDNPDDSDEAAAMTARFLNENNDKYKRWEIIEPATGEAEFDLPQQSNHQSGAADCKIPNMKTPIVSYEEIMQSFEVEKTKTTVKTARKLNERTKKRNGVRQVLVSASPEERQGKRYVNPK